MRAVPPILFLNVVVFLMWSFYSSEDGVKFMYENFLVSWDSLVDGRYWTLVTSAFSHNWFWHIFINMYVLNSFGTVLESALGTRKFLQLYFFASIVSGVTHAAVSAFILDAPD